MENSNRKKIGIANEKNTRDGKLFYAGTICLDDIQDAWIEKKHDKFKQKDVRNISITLWKSTSKNGKEYWSISMSPPYKPEQGGQNFNAPIDDDPPF